MGKIHMRLKASGMKNIKTVNGEKRMKVYILKELNLAEMKPDEFYLVQDGDKKRFIRKTKDGKLEFYEEIVDADY